MTYKAHIRNGVAVLDQDVKLPEGSEVLIQPVETPGSLASLLAEVAGKGVDMPSDGLIQHDHYVYGTPRR